MICLCRVDKVQCFIGTGSCSQLRVGNREWLNVVSDHFPGGGECPPPPLEIFEYLRILSTIWCANFYSTAKFTFLQSEQTRGFLPCIVGGGQNHALAHYIFDWWP